LFIRLNRLLREKLRWILLCKIMIKRSKIIGKWKLPKFSFLSLIVESIFEYSVLFLYNKDHYNEFHLRIVSFFNKILIVALWKKYFNSKIIENVFSVIWIDKRMNWNIYKLFCLSRKLFWEKKRKKHRSCLRIQTFFHNIHHPLWLLQKTKERLMTKHKQKESVHMDIQFLFPFGSDWILWSMRIRFFLLDKK